MSSETIDLFVNDPLTMDLALDLEEYFSQQWDPAKPAPAAPPAAAAPAFAPVGVKREREEEEDMAGWPFKTLRLEEGAKGWASAAPCHEEEEDEEEDEEGSLFGDSESLSPNHLHTPGAGADRMVPHYTLGQGGIPTMDQMVAMPLKELNQIRKVITLSQEDAKILRCRRKRLKNKEAATRSRNRKESQLEALSRQVRELTERCQQQEQTISTLQRRTEVLQHQLRAKEGPAAQRE